MLSSATGNERLDASLSLLEAWMLFHPFSERLANENVHEALHLMFSDFRDTYCHLERESLARFPPNRLSFGDPARVRMLRQEYAKALSDPQKREHVRLLLDPPGKRKGGLLCFVETTTADDEAVLDLFYVFPKIQPRLTGSLSSYGIRIHDLLRYCCCGDTVKEPPPKATLLRWEKRESVSSALFPTHGGNSDSSWYLDSTCVPVSYIRTLRILTDAATTSPWKTFMQARNMYVSVDRVFSRLRSEQGVFSAAAVPDTDIIALSRQLSYDALVQQLEAHARQQRCSLKVIEQGGVAGHPELSKNLQNAITRAEDAARVENAMRRIHVLSRGDTILGMCLEVSSFHQNRIIVSSTRGILRAGEEDATLRIFLKTRRTFGEEGEGVQPASIEYVLKEALNWCSYPA